MWGVNDFDEAAKMPYALDIVRLAASAVLAKVPGITPRRSAPASAEGYAKGLKAPAPVRARSRAQMAARYRRGERQGPQEILGEVRSRADRRGEAGQESIRSRRSDDCAAATARRSSARGPIAGSRWNSYFARGRHRQPRAAALLRRRPVAGRPDRARGEGDGPLGLVARAWRRAQAALRRDRVGDVSQSRSDLSCCAGSVLVRRLSPNDFKIEVEQPKKNGKAKKDKEGKGSHALAARGSWSMPGCCTRWATTRIDPSRHAGEGRSSRPISTARAEGWLLAAATAIAAAIEAEQREWKTHPASAATQKPTDDNKCGCGDDRLIRLDQQNASVRGGVRMRPIFGIETQGRKRHAPPIRRGQAPRIPQAA